MRTVVTAWSNGEESARALLESGQLDEVDPVDLAMHLLGALQWLGYNLARATGETLDDFLQGLWAGLGTQKPGEWVRTSGRGLAQTTGSGSGMS